MKQLVRKRNYNDRRRAGLQRLNRVAWENGHYRRSEEFGLGESHSHRFHLPRNGRAVTSVAFCVESMTIVKARSYLFP